MAAVCGDKKGVGRICKFAPLVYMVCTGYVMPVQAICYRDNSSLIIDCNFDIWQ